jgi:hypothetical protein
LTSSAIYAIIKSQRTKEVKKMAPDSVLGWFVVVVLANAGLIRFGVAIIRDRENYKRENDKYWEDHGWGK